MRIAVDVREACKNMRTGKAQWTFGFVSALLQRTDVSLLLFSDRPLPDAWMHSMRGTTHRHALFPQSGISWHFFVARSLKKNNEADAYLSPTSYIVPFLLGKKFVHIPIVHDLIAFRNEPHDRKATLIECLTLKRAASTARMIGTVSETTKRDLLDRYGALDAQKIVPLFAGPMSTPRTRSAHPSAILCIATLCPRKNQRRLIEAYAKLPDALKKSHPLILVGGRGWRDEEIILAAQRTTGVEWKKYLPQNECDELLQNAAVLAFPSLYEGFGMPILDAFACKVPVLTSAVGSMREVAGDAAVLVDPLNVDSIAQALQHVLTDDSLRARLIAAGTTRFADFSWDRSANLFVEGLKAHMERIGASVTSEVRVS